jgi:ABC-type transport system substrate-binding protein
MDVVPEQSTRLARLQTGEAGFADSVTGPPLEQLLGDDTYNVFQVPETAQVVIHFHSSTQPPYNDPRFRRALRAGMDQQALIDGLLGAGSISPPAHGVFPVTPGYDATILAPQEYDPELATSLLAEAGLENQSVKLNVYDSSSTPLIPQMIQAIADMWRDVGITAEIEQREAATHFDAWRARELTDLAPLSTPAWFVTESLLLTHWRSDGPYASVVDEEMDAMVNAILAEFDEEAQISLMHDLWAYEVEQAYHVSLPYVTSAWGTRVDTIANWEPGAAVPYPNRFWTLQLQA